MAKGQFDAHQTVSIFYTGGVQVLSIEGVEEAFVSLDTRRE